MKQSEILKKEFDKEDNDLKALGIFRKVLREERMEKFEENWLEKITSSPNITQYQMRDGGYIFWFKDGNIVDFYPKANKLLIRKQNKWIKPGLKWLISKI
jgi:hypothetical protein